MYDVAAACTIYTYMLRPIAPSGAERFVFFWICHLSSCIYLFFFFCVLFQFRHPWLAHEQTGAPRVQQWPELKSVTSSITSCHPSTPPSALSFLHWRARPSLFRTEWVVHVLFNVMRTRLPPHPSVLHQVWQQLLKMVMAEQEGAHQQEMEKKEVKLQQMGSRERCFAFIKESLVPLPSTTKSDGWYSCLITNNVVFSHKVWKLLELLSKVNCLEKELLQKRTKHR